MHTLLAVIAVINLLLLLGVIAGLLYGRGRLPGLRATAGAGAATEPGTSIRIEVRNSLELARQHHWLAGVIGAVTPELVHGIVQKEVARILRDELEARGVQADVRVDG